MGSNAENTHINQGDAMTDAEVFFRSKLGVKLVQLAEGQKRASDRYHAEAEAAKAKHAASGGES